MVIVYYTLLDKQIPDACAQRWYTEIAPAQQARIRRLRAARRRHSSLVGLQLLKRACQALNISDFDLNELNYPAEGKPNWRPALDFNISHSHQLVACAASRRCLVGIDVERIRDYQFGVAERVLDKPEQERVKQDETAFFDIWTAKEAVVKACGRGIGSLSKVHTHVDDAQFEDARWFLRRLSLGPDYAGHVATNTRGVPLMVEGIAVEELCDAAPATHNSNGTRPTTDVSGS